MRAIGGYRREMAAAVDGGGGGGGGGSGGGGGGGGKSEGDAEVAAASLRAHCDGKDCQAMCAFIQALCSKGTASELVVDVFKSEWNAAIQLAEMLPAGMLRVVRAPPRVATDRVLANQGGCGEAGADGLRALRRGVDLGGPAHDCDGGAAPALRRHATAQPGEGGGRGGGGERGGAGGEV